MAENNIEGMKKIEGASSNGGRSRIRAGTVSMCSSARRAQCCRCENVLCPYQAYRFCYSRFAHCLVAFDI